MHIACATTGCKCKPGAQLYLREGVMWAGAGELLRLPKELDRFPGMEAGLKRQRIVGRVHEDKCTGSEMQEGRVLQHHSTEPGQTRRGVHPLLTESDRPEPPAC